MLQKLYKQRKQQEGFTIIEILIVLAIAGLIMLIVFLAVPALERTSRNTQRKNDASAIASSIANFIDNNGGTLPTKVGMDNTTSVLYIDAGGSGNSETAKLGYYTTPGTGSAGGSGYAGNVGSVYITATPATAPTLTDNSGSAASATNVTPESISIITGWGCNASNTGISSTSSPRSASIFYATETGSGEALQCLEQ